MRRVPAHYLLLIFFIIRSPLDAAFERVSIGTRANGMGGAFVAVCNDAILIVTAICIIAYRVTIAVKHNAVIAKNDAGLIACDVLRERRACVYC